jgi:hypothetical protein
MDEIWIVLVEDRHADVEAFPFSTEERAIAYAREQVQENARHPESISEEELTPAMREDGWVFFMTYSTEGDCVRVVKRSVDAEAH